MDDEPIDGEEALQRLSVVMLYRLVQQRPDLRVAIVAELRRRGAQVIEQ